jgi:tRNA-2-methylthio-N6-dimethylallyladenosine synthase
VAQKLYIKTFGCQMNEYDSGKMADVLNAVHGMVPTDAPDDADVILFNTCSVREKGRKGVSTIWAASSTQQCAARRSSASAVVWQVRKARQSSSARLMSTLVFDRRRCIGCRTCDSRAPRKRRPSGRHPFPEIEKFDCSPPARVEGSRAFVSIMEGCSKYRSFCVVPYTRGEEISRPLDDVPT